ncbi:hypothetical protein J6590_076501 [Homalodisca vitripennis]|nr:hypothetical protein J6590_076501 [Homalodisca vitripennis]
MRVSWHILLHDDSVRGSGTCTPCVESNNRMQHSELSRQSVYHLRRQELCDGICKANKVGQQGNRLISNLYITPAIP